MLAAGDTVDDLLRAYAWLEREDVLACLAYAREFGGFSRVLAGMRALRRRHCDVK